MNNTTSSQNTILIIDDLPDNLLMLFDLLTKQNFKVLAAKNGPKGLQSAEFAQPELILLDVMMPGMDGFEVCQKLKADEKTRDIPVIFMTALTEIVDKLKGFRLGAADYITKPVQQEEVLARIDTHLKIRQQQKQIRFQNEQLQERTRLLEERTRELERRNLELDAFAHTVAHGLKNPLCGISTLADLLLSEDCADHHATSLKRLKMILLSSHKMFNLIEALLMLAGVSRQSEVQIQRLNMAEIVYQVQQRLTLMVKEYQGHILVPNQWPVAVGYAPWVEEIWFNFLSNGLKYGGQPPHLEVGADLPTDGTVRFWVKDNGKGLSSAAQQRLFTPFTRLHTKVEGHGLGLSIVQRIVERLGGQVGVDSEVGQGSRFYFTLPETNSQEIE